MLRLTRDNAVKDLFLSHLIKKRNKKEISLKTNNNKQMIEKEYLDADVKSCSVILIMFNGSFTLCARCY